MCVLISSQYLYSIKYIQATLNFSDQTISNKILLNFNATKLKCQVFFQWDPFTENVFISPKFLSCLYNIHQVKDNTFLLASKNLQLPFFPYTYSVSALLYMKPKRCVYTLIASLEANFLFFSSFLKKVCLQFLQSTVANSLASRRFYSCLQFD